jgi:NAD(P)-dependent dehydrogenase (short-subunit alcohol dehydrogenase family)
MKSERHQIALVTGSSSGIGFETPLLLARNGMYTYHRSFKVLRAISANALWYTVPQDSPEEQMPLLAIFLARTRESTNASN